MPNSTAYAVGHTFLFQTRLILRSRYLYRAPLFQKEIFAADQTHRKAQTARGPIRRFLQLALTYRAKLRGRSKKKKAVLVLWKT